MKNLKLYTASAGAGKTYRLALSYISRLFSSAEAYRNILAVTFTNKAAAEMKKRILEKLSQLYRGDPLADDYAHYLMDLGLARDKDHLKEKAGDILLTILHDYSAFYVETIDRFFQWVIRGFTREIGLQNGYKLELDRESVLSQAVDLLIFNMDEDELLKRWLIEFAEEKITEGKGWDFSADVFSLGNEVFRESYQSIRDEVIDSEQRKEKYISLRDKVNETISRIENDLRKQAVEALEMIKSAGLEISDFKGGTRGVITIFTKVLKYTPDKVSVSDTNRNGVEDFSVWVTKKSPYTELIRDLYDNGLRRLLSGILKVYDDEIPFYNTAVLLKNNIYTFGILNDISDRIREIAREKNLFLISDSALFLKKIINENDAPFIFEKAGNYFSCYMLDEFQDTSRFQWDNFLPLIQNSLSMGNTSLIVGDVKQSIYRWRNSDWKILATELKESIPPERIENISLDTNYRSDDNIVLFNNAVFNETPKILKEIISSELAGKGASEFEAYWLNLIDEVYTETGQKISGKNDLARGFVSIQFNRNQRKSEQMDRLKTWVPDRVKELQDRGYGAGDITFLVRSAKEGREIARILMEQENHSGDGYNFNVISNDSLYLENNSGVKYLLALIRFFHQPYDSLNTTFIKHEYLSYLKATTDQKINWHRVFRNTNTKLSIEVEDECFTEFMNELDSLRRLPLYQLIERLIRIFKLNYGEEQIAYIQGFQDVVLEFTRKESSDTNAFLDYWKSTGTSATLNVSETQDALRIMTIHKAKGLEFRAVIIPFCDWFLYPDTRGNKNITLWPRTDRAGYEEFTYLPVTYSSMMRESSFWSEYYEEMFRTFVDNLNLLYVAFTRAASELHCFSTLSERPEKITNAGDLLFEICKNQDHPEGNENIQIAGLEENFNREDLSFRFGSPSKKQVMEDVSNKIITGILEYYPINNVTTKLNFNHKNIYLSDLKETEKGKTGYGTQMHEIFASIKRREDIEGALRKAWLKGLLSSSEIEKLNSEINEKLGKPPFNDWFSDKWEVRNETDLVGRNAKILRPDRVMIEGRKAIVLDYKFGHEQKKSYRDQLLGYRQVLNQMGYEDLVLFLWYYNLDELEEVEE